MMHARHFAVWLFVLAIYIGAPLKIGHVPIPDFLAGVAGLFLLAVNFGQVRKQHVQLLAGLMLLATFGEVANFGDGADMARVKGGLQLVYSVVIAAGLYFELRCWGRERVAKLFLVILSLIVAGCILELNLDFFRNWSDSFRSYVFDDGTLYKSEFREKFGNVRPKLFTLEPSYVAIFFVLSMTVWYSLATKNLVRFWMYFVTVVVGMILIRSPILLLMAIIPAFNFLLANEISGNPLKVLQTQGEVRKFLVTVMFGFALVLIMLVIWKKSDMLQFHFASSPAVTQDKLSVQQENVPAPESRLDQILEGKEDSFTGRLVAPPIIAWHVLDSSPWFGVGLEAKERLNGVVFEVFEQLGMQMNIVKFSQLGKFVTNAFWLNWIYFGLFGGLLMVFWMYVVMRQLGVKYRSYSFLLMVIFMQTMGGYVTPRLWFVCFLIMLLGTLSNSAEKLEEMGDAAK